MYTAQHHPEWLSARERAKVAKMLMTLFNHWELDSIAQLTLLGLSPTSRAMLARYRRGDTPLPYAQDMLDRAGWLLVIHYALRSLYQHDPRLCYGWVKLPNQLFEGRSPIDYMMQHGLIGIAKVARYLQQQVMS